ncbi:SDR family NAD(P)-dependent oxidoreductase [uncultured Roseivirga sp.]|uniref:SDR family NAD(P)-dependent oxidoreductase n=1 Tax=uncultured Roseivirga sp. TaxID=543088 RepID=UPI000D794574|nr:SDR family NAD(P)-dependent oxidoreductase [uncultured Roseivirga sp.]PWL27236.1 MAG: short chain dehydrogenase [Roseivirga sp. XM-24bin3]
MILKDSNIIITGAGGAFGSFLVQELSPLVSNVIGVDVNLDNVPSYLFQLRNASFIEADITSEDKVDRLFDQLKADYTQLHGLINNAGVIHSEPLVNLLSRESPLHSMKNWQKVVDINLTGTFIMSSRMAHAMMSKRVKGAIINISSISAYGNAGQSAYAASKAGVIGLTKTWAKELGIWGIRANAIAPGFFDTGSTHQAIKESIVKHVIKETPLRKLGKPTELAHTVKYILENDFLNGEVIDLTGGLTI